jgi:integrase/recombinase XerD
MTALAPILQGFFTDRLMRQRHTGPNTIAAYRDTCQLLLQFVHNTTGIAPSKLDIADLDARLITAFLQHLESERANRTATRNARLAAIHSLFRYAALHAPEHAEQISRILAIPPKRCDRALVCFLTAEETDALLAAPDRTTWLGRRDHTLMLVACQTGLRVSELIGLTRADVHLESGAHVYCRGKGRKNRSTPLTRQTVAALQVWLTERGGDPTDPVFSTGIGRRLSRDAIEKLVAKHAARAASRCPTIAAKHVTPHTLRHSAVICTASEGMRYVGSAA